MSRLSYEYILIRLKKFNAMKNAGDLLSEFFHKILFLKI